MAGLVTLLPEQAVFPTSNSAAFKRVDGTNFPFTVIAFNGSSDQVCHFKVLTPGYASGSLTVKFHWSAASATSNGPVWGASFAAVTADTDSGALESKAFGTEQTVADTHLGTNAGRVMVCSLTLSNTDSLADGDVCFIKVRRISSDGSDTMSGDAYLERITVAWT